MFESVQSGASDLTHHGATATPRIRGLQTPLLDRELLRAHRVAADRLEQDDLAWLARGFRAYLASQGRLPLERCLRLPSNAAARQRAVRDYWLRVAWSRVNGDLTPWCRSESLAHIIRRFRVSQWARWKDLAGNPAAADSIEQALLEAFRSHERIPSTAMQLHNIAQRTDAD